MITMGLYIKYLSNYRRSFFIAIGCVVLEAIGDLLGPTLMSYIIRRGIERSDLSAVIHGGAFMLLVTAAGAGCAITRNILSSRISQRMGADLRADLFRKTMSFAEASADRIESGSLITRLTNDTSQIILFINGVMRIFLKAPILCVGSIVLASLLNFRLSLIIYAVVGMVGILIFISMSISYKRFYRLQKAIDRINSKVQEYLIGIRLIKAFGTFDQETARFDQTNRDLMQKGISSQMVITIISPLLTLVVGVGTAVIIFTGSRLFTLGQADTGDITAFTIYMAQVLTSLIMITNIFTVFVRTKASTVRIAEIFACEDDCQVIGAGQEGAVGRSGHHCTLSGAITFDRVTFAYPGGSGLPALSDLSFTVNAGETLAIIGPTGSGKSTIGWLLLRFYDVDEGEIRLDGVNIKSLDVAEIRRNTAIVPQKPMLFSGSVADNLHWGDRHATINDMRAAVEKAQADFIQMMPDNYDSVLGSGAVNLSGGQKQRLSIARGLLKKAPILILDDATSALDAVTEAKVRNNLRNNSTAGTIIMITQRCGTAMSADKILVMEDGRAAGFGSHEELMDGCSVYRDIYHTQIESI
jgi:ATP-binding cassette subfamily B protein